MSNYAFFGVSSVAVAGSRHGTPYAVAPVLAALVSAGVIVRTGCARGVDALARAGVPCGQLCVLDAQDFKGANFAQQLANRTVAVVMGAGALVVFPGADGIGRGSALAIATALRVGLPCWVAGVAPSGHGWQPLALAGVAGWACVPPPSLFD